MKGLLISLSLLVLSGCSALDKAISPEVRYGQLYALEDALSTAGNRCSDKEAAFTATYWATTTVNNISEHSEFLEVGGAQQSKSKELVKQLYSLQYVAYDDDANCQRFSIAGGTTRELLALLNN